MDKIIVIAGGNGFLGRYLTEYFTSIGWKVRVIARKRKGASSKAAFYQWDGKNIGDWSAALKGATAVVNLAGRTVNCRYNKRNKQQILNSRIDTTRVLASALNEMESPPNVWLNSSTATIYRHAQDYAQTDEAGEIGEGFSVGRMGKLHLPHWHQRRGSQIPRDE